MQPLPRDGAVVVGRVAGCDVQINDHAVSRQHARIELADGRATVIDLGSQNGTLVNNQRVERRELVGGDVLTIGTGVLVFHGPSAAAPAVAMVGWDELRTVLGRELDRVAHFGRELAVVHVRVGGDDRGHVATELAAHLRTLDLAAWTPERDLCLLLPEVDGLRSRWITPLQCAWCTASHSSANSATRAASGRDAWRRWASRVTPSTRSITKYGWPSARPASSTLARPG